MRQQDADLIDQLLDIADNKDINNDICDAAKKAAIRIRQLVDDRTLSRFTKEDIERLVDPDRTPLDKFISEVMGED